MRDRLIELIKQKSCVYELACDRECGGCHNVEMYDDQIESIADHLLAEGVIVPPCKVGDRVYHFSSYLGGIFPYFVESLNIGSIGKNETYWNYEANYHDEETDELVDEIDFDLDDLGKTVFLTREEAERALERREE